MGPLSQVLASFDKQSNWMGPEGTGFLWKTFKWYGTSIECHQSVQKELASSKKTCLWDVRGSRRSWFLLTNIQMGLNQGSRRSKLPPTNSKMGLDQMSRMCWLPLTNCQMWPKGVGLLWQPNGRWPYVKSRRSWLPLTNGKRNGISVQTELTNSQMEMVQSELASSDKRPIWMGSGVQDFASFDKQPHSMGPGVQKELASSDKRPNGMGSGVHDFASLDK